MADRPVVLAAFANVHGETYLRSLAGEAHALKGLLDTDGSLCRYEEVREASLERILDIAQRAENRDRIAILHYAGHAGPDTLHLEAGDGRSEAIDAAALAEFFACQSNLALVFLNGCSTEQQAEAFREAGAPAVIITTRAIDDEVAAAFSERFYRGVAGGYSIAAAFRQAESAARAQAGGQIRAVLTPMLRDQPAAAARWPWTLIPERPPGTELAWTLSGAAGDPLYRLPLPDVDFPAQPYPHLHWYTAADARVFHGRDGDIAAVCRRLLDETGRPIVLFFGESGVGKSSLLEAGVRPRLSGQCDLRIRRRDATVGLAGALDGAVPGASGGGTLRERWRAAEEASGRALVVVLDQVEEIYTHAMPGAGGSPAPTAEQEFAALAELLNGVFGGTVLGEPEGRPRGRVVLSFRHEWFTRIEQLLIGASLRYDRSIPPLERLSRQGVIEAIERPLTAAGSPYGIALPTPSPGERSLAELIADDVLRDPDTPVAPVLQIIMHEVLKKARRRDAAQPTLRPDDFDSRTHGRNAIVRHVREQIAAIRDEGDWKAVGLEKPVKQGLVLDVLMRHVSPDDTSQQIVRADLDETYGHLLADIGPVIAACERRRLLDFVGLDGKGDEHDGARDGAEGDETHDDRPMSTRLLHDTLAPAVRRLDAESNSRGRKARRAIENAFDGVPEGERPPYSRWLSTVFPIFFGYKAMRKLEPRERNWIVRTGYVTATAAVLVVGLLIAAGLYDTRLLAEEWAGRVPGLDASHLEEELGQHEVFKRRALRTAIPTDPAEPSTREKRIAAFKAAYLLSKVDEPHPETLLAAVGDIPLDMMPLLASAVEQTHKSDRESDAKPDVVTTRAALGRLFDFDPSATDEAAIDDEMLAFLRPRLVLAVHLAQRDLPFAFPAGWFGPNNPPAFRTQLMRGVAADVPAELLGEQLPDEAAAVLFAGASMREDAGNGPGLSPAAQTRLQELIASPSVLARSHAIGALRHERLAGRIHVEAPAVGPLRMISRTKPGGRLAPIDLQDDDVDLGPVEWLHCTVADLPSGSNEPDWGVSPLGFDLIRIPDGGEPLWIGATEVPAEMFAHFLDEWERAGDEHTSPVPPLSDQLRDRFVIDAIDRPAQGVSFDEAIGFCNWLTDRLIGSDQRCYRWDGATRPVAMQADPAPRLPASRSPLRVWTFDPDRRGFRLPTPDQWQRAAAGGSQARFFFGADPMELEHFGWVDFTSVELTESADPQPHPIATKLPNAFGLFDTHGNLREWCWPQSGSVGSGRGDPMPTYAGRVGDGTNSRDGAFVLPAKECDLADPGTPLPVGQRYAEVGFRVAWPGLGATDAD